MKIRNGFVSNSSSTSFCVYGWIKDDLNQTVKDTLKKIEAEESRNFKRFYIECGTSIGFGRKEDAEYNEDGEPIESEIDGPTTEEVEYIDAITKKYNLPSPSYYSGTFRDG